MAISDKTAKILWSSAAGLCSFEGCGEKLFFGGSAPSSSFTIGEMAHITGKKAGSNRHIEELGDTEDDYSNLILLCPNHHTEIDAKENEKKYSIDVLVGMKEKHEKSVAMRLSSANDKHSICNQIMPLLKDNFVGWSNYGPQSERARKNPHSDGVYDLWLTIRLSTIVPNNRKIERIINDGRNLFSADENSIISRFFHHVQSYELWVMNEINYDAVVRFPTEFEEMIRRGANASS